jgi:hypothetical protein
MSVQSLVSRACVIVLVVILYEIYETPKRTLIKTQTEEQQLLGITVLRLITL